MSVFPPAVHAATLETLLPQLGELIVARNRKYNGDAHWVVPGRYLGRDNYGHWVFQGSGEFISRPGTALYTASDATLLIPHEGDWVATFFDRTHPSGVELYIDLATEFSWQRIQPAAVEFHMVDMDLDVIRTAERGLFVDDQDEFAAHRVLMDYPAELCTRMESTTAALMDAVASRQAPFDGRDAAWLTLGRSLP
ncbi:MULTISPECIES: DUF402 domain-containing protein [Arthrobacter]|uniref:DUF402 domain-containing protein n=1 Tax=Arthrobacter TaxID=1663 RepID=UPI000AA995CD|nr:MULTISPECIES: DUF402 domain-containing protein [Arthrobacter]